MSRANYYVYYRVEPGAAAQARAGVERLFDAIERRTGVRGALMRRRDDPKTWMEVYEGIDRPDEFEALLAAEVERLGLARAPDASSARHVEAFVAFDD